MTAKQQSYKKNRLLGLSAFQSAIKAGYSESIAKNATQRLDKVGIFEVLFVKAGIDDLALIKLIQEGMNANRVISANITYGEADGKTTDFIDVPDWQSRHKFIELALKLMKKIEDKPLFKQELHTHYTVEVKDVKSDGRKENTVRFTSKPENNLAG